MVIPQKEIIMIAKKITSDKFDRRLLQVLSFGGAPVVLICCTRLVQQLAADPGQQVIGILSACALSVGIVVLGIVGRRPAAAG